METNWLDDYLRDWPATTCAVCGESCLGCEGVIKLGELWEGRDTRKVAHGACYKKWMPTFEEFKQRVSMTCLLCRQPCDSSENVQQLALGHAMHGECHKKWLIEQDSNNILRRARRAADLPTVVLPGEEGMSREQVARRRRAQLFGRPRQSSATTAAKPHKEITDIPPANSCNEGASADAEGEDSRSEVA